jgi:hypothetical protein
MNGDIQIISALGFLVAGVSISLILIFFNKPKSIPVQLTPMFIGTVITISLSVIFTMEEIDRVNVISELKSQYLSEQKALLDSLNCTDLKEYLKLAFENKLPLDQTNMDYGIKKLGVIC